MTSQKHIIVVHGFLLSGTGSNIYSCNLASQWKKQGYAITVYCQDPDAGGYDWVDEYYTHKVNSELSESVILRSVTMYLYNTDTNSLLTVR